MGLFENIFKWKRRDDEPEYEIEDWNEIVYDRDDLQINDKKQRKEYVQGCLEQIAEASKELEELEFEYNMVTSYLKDMEEIEALPEEEREILCECAKKIDALEEQRSKAIFSRYPCFSLRMSLCGFTIFSSIKFQMYYLYG